MSLIVNHFLVEFTTSAYAIAVDGTTQIKLQHIIDDGPDFERVSFVLC